MIFIKRSETADSRVTEAKLSLVIEHSVIDLSALPRRRVNKEADAILWGRGVYGAELHLDCPRPLIDLREISRPGCRYIIASRMYRKQEDTK